jgi:2-deoxy-D-gluconate 3-dehydrogenase
VEVVDMSTETFSLDGKNVLVTGASRGIGLAIALGFGRAGAKNIVIISRKEAELLEAKKKIEETGARVIAVPTHVGKGEDIDALFDTIKKEVKTLDILVNNVGMNIFTPQVVDADVGMWDKIVDTNLKSVFLVSQRAARMMREEKKGKIISVSTVAARRATPGLGIYGVAKAGVEMLTKVLAVELAPYNIQVNAIALAMFRTKFSEPLWSNPDILSQVEASNPMHRIGEPEEVVGAALFLASDASSFVTGTVVTLDGGTTA